MPHPCRNAASAALLLFLLLSGPMATESAALPPEPGPMADRLLPGLVAAPPSHPLVFRFARLTEWGHQIDTTRVEVTAPGWEGASLVTLETVGIKGDRVVGTVSFHNGSRRPLFGVRLDFGLRVETCRGEDASGKPTTLVRSADVGESTPLFLGDIGRGEDTTPLPFSIGPVGFKDETISVEFQAALSGYTLERVVTTADSIDLAPSAQSEGLDRAPRRVRAGELTQPARFSRCYCRIDSIVAVGADSRPLATPPPVRAGHALGGLNALVACDLDPADHVYTADRNFTTADSSGAPLARISRFDPLGHLVTTWGWGAPDLTPPHLPIGRIREPEGLAVLSDGRVLVQQKARPKKRAEIMIFAPFPPPIPSVAPAAR